jgi:hypothetical protein
MFGYELTWTAEQPAPAGASSTEPDQPLPVLLCSLLSAIARDMLTGWYCTRIPEASDVVEKYSADGWRFEPDWHMGFAGPACVQARR